LAAIIELTMDLRIGFLLFFCALLAGCGGSLTRRGPLDPGLAAFIPPDSVALVGVRVDQVRKTSIYRKLGAGKRVPRFDDFRVEDVHELLLASDGKNVLAIARGDFHPNPSFTLADNKTALAGPEAMVRAAISRYKSGAHDAPRDLMARAQGLPADTQIWAVVSGWRGIDPEQLRAMGNAANVDRLMRSVEGANLTVDLRAGVHATLSGDCRTEADAGSLADSLRGLASLARIGLTHNQPDLVPVFDGIQVRQEGRGVKMNLDVSQAVADKLSDKVR
jgi:hypothetical protein